jgi:hypothetical protein
VSGRRRDTRGLAGSRLGGNASARPRPATGAVARSGRTRAAHCDRSSTWSVAGGSCDHAPA